ncbi:MAG: aspartate/tyrosine/aromatic aminotransferase [Burkholderiales bacterium]|jgi:aromatic-amino-acid transaminase|nr:aspartate/tyrosine/aromatic aminotransferase [Burkholderiales bacterium]
MSPSPFSAVPFAPRDPILGLSEAFAADPRPTKVNLGVGVYVDENGKIPVLRAVREAEQARAATAAPRGYLPIDGIAAYDAAVQKLLFGENSLLVASGRVVTAQGLGGTGALKIAADFLRRALPNATVLISDPSWENHRALFEQAGFVVENYPYYDAVTNGLDFVGMSAALRAAAPGTVAVLHACCHNPTGVDLDAAHWAEVVRIVRERQLIPVLDFAYQGFGDGIDADATAIKLFADSGLDFFVASSFSKSFSLYGERVGALTVVAADKDEATRILSQMKRVIRANYSTPPTHGGSVIAAILGDARLRALWEEDLAGMRDRIKAMRQHLIDGLKTRGVTRDFSFVLRQRGMFSYSGLTPEQMQRLASDFGIYGLSTGRICVAALNPRNIDAVCDAISAVL